MYLHFVIRICLLYICLLVTQYGYAQKSDYTLKGAVDVDTGTIYMIPAFTLVYFPEDISTSSAIVKGKFNFSGSISYPVPSILYIKAGDKIKYRSTIFFLDKGEQKADWKVDEKYSSAVNINNAATNEQAQYLSLYQQNDERLYQLNVSLNGLGTDANSATIRVRLQREKDSLERANEQITLNNLRQHPESFIPLWDMVYALDRGYNPFLDSFNNALPAQLKNSVTGKAYSAGVAKLRMTAIGSIFPTMEVSDIKGQKTMVSGKNKYTLVDFWYTSCFPCRRLFPGFKKIYEAYHDKGFELIAVSTDEGKYIDDWKQFLNDNPLPWPQYLDDNKRNAEMLLITRYPTSFLLDSEGRILKQDMLPDELEKFLEANLK